MSKRLTVGVDIRDLNISKTGARTFLEELYRQFKNEDGEFTFHFFDSSIPVYNGRNKMYKLIEHLRFIAWKQVVLPLKAMVRGCDVVFCTDYFVPYIKPGYKTVAVFHDAFFYEYPEHYNRHWLTMFKWLGIGAAKRAEYVITPTEYAREQLLHYTNLASERIVAIPEAPKSVTKSAGSRERNKPLNLPHGPYILHIGTLEKRKNLVTLLEALYLLRKSGYNYSLVLAGQRSPKTDMDDSPNIRAAIKKYKLHEYVHLTGYVSDQDLPQLYKNAALYAFPSVNEGFGLPILEAFSYDVPVIVAGNTCLPEVGGEAVLTFDPYDVEDLASKIKLLTDEPALRTSLIEKGQQRLQHFSWEKTAAAIKAIFKKAVDNR